MGLARSATNRVVIGVCGGLAGRLRVSPAWLRLAFIVAGLASGVGVAIYFVVGLLMLPPTFDEGSIRARVRTNLTTTWTGLRDLFFRAIDALQRFAEVLRGEGEKPDVRALLGGSLFLVGLTVLLMSFGLFWWLTLWRALALALALIGLSLLAGRAAEPSGPPETE